MIVMWRRMTIVGILNVVKVGGCRIGLGMERVFARTQTSRIDHTGRDKATYQVLFAPARNGVSVAVALQIPGLLIDDSDQLVVPESLADHFFQLTQISERKRRHLVKVLQILVEPSLDYCS